MKMINNLREKIPKNVPYKKWLIISVILIVIGCFFAFTEPVFLKMMIKFLCVGKPGHYIRRKHESKQKFTYKLYLWNVTNPNEITAGADKPKMQEVGPYVFSQLKQKRNSTDNKTEDTVTFRYWNFYKFNRKLSAPLTGDETVTLLNVVIAAATLKTKLESPHLMNLLNESMNLIFKNPSSIFVTMTAMDFIENGIQIDCNQTVYAAKVACTEFRKHKLITMVNDDKTRLRYRWFDRINNTLQPPFTVMRGSKDIRDIGRVLAVNGQPKLKIYKEHEMCNVINGTDGMFFAPFQQKYDVLWVYSDNGCKSMPLRYKNMKRKHGVKAAYKVVNFADPLMNPACECNRYIGCAYKGTIDLFACWNVFILGSAPHFYSADPTVREKIIGMNPKEDLHETGVYFDLLSSGPILAFERFQINFLIKQNEYRPFNSIAEDVFIPLLWYEERYRMEILDLGLIIGSIVSIVTGILAGYLLLCIGIIGCIVVIALRINQHVAVMPEALVIRLNQHVAVDDASLER